jgi:RNA polymerase sigma-B factor
MMSPTKRRQRRRQHPLLDRAWDLVPPIARRYALASPEPFDDLVQEGMLGLLTAAERYRSSDDIPFDCFARPHIRGAILHHLRDRAWSVRLPRRQAERLQTMRQGTQAWDGLQAVHRDDLKRWAAMVRPACLEELSMVSPGFQQSDQGLDVCLPSAEETQYRPASLHASWEDGTTEQMLALLEPRLRLVLQCVVLKGWSYRRTAAKLKVSAATVQRLLHKGLQELRSSLQQARLRNRLSRRAPSVA